MSHELEVKYILGILELLEVRRVTIGDSRTGKLVSRERFAELLAPHIQPRAAPDDRPDHDEMAEIPYEERYAVTNFPYTKPSNPNNAAPRPTYYVGHPDGSFTVADPQP